MADGVYLTDEWKRRSEKSGLRWRVRVRDRHSGAWRTQTFPSEQRALALAWGREIRDNAAAVAVAAINAPPAAVVVKTADVLASLLKQLKKRGRSDGHSEEVQRVVQGAIDAGISDLNEPAVHRQADEWLEKIPRIGEATRARYRSHLRAIGKHALKNWAAELGGRDPFAPLSGEPISKDAPEVFTVAEARALVGDAALADTFGLAVALAMYTGMRLREVIWLRWQNVYSDRRQIVVTPPTKDERAQGHRVKRDKTRRLPIQPELLPLLASLPRTDDYLFDEHMRTRNNTQYGRYLRDVMAAAGVNHADSDGNNRSFHSLRHTHIALALACGIDSLHLQIYAGHSDSKMTAHYAQSVEKLRPDADRWGGEFYLRRAAP